MIYFVVEGKTDTNKLQAIFPHFKTIETNGSEINKETLELIRQTAKIHEVIIFTDPDGPGKKIRQTIIEEIPNLKHAFIEKSKCIKKNKVGIAEASKEDIIKALNLSISFTNKKSNTLFWREYISLGYIGRADSKRLRATLAKKIGIEYANGKTLFK